MNLPSPFYKAIKILSDVDINAPIKEVALSVGMNESYFIRAFKKTVGVSPLAYRNEKRITVAKNLLHETDFSVNEIASLCGFNDAMYFSRLFKLKEGISPLAYRRKVKNLP
jgi:AraC-like DNA-binding protein